MMDVMDPCAEKLTTFQDVKKWQQCIFWMHKFHYWAVAIVRFCLITSLSSATVL